MHCTGTVEVDHCSKGAKRHSFAILPVLFCKDTHVLKQLKAAPQTRRFKTTSLVLEILARGHASSAQAQWRRDGIGSPLRYNPPLKSFSIPLARLRYRDS